MNSTSASLNILPTSLTSNNTHITRTNAFVIKGFNKEPDLTKFISHSQASFLSKTQTSIQCVQRRSSFQTNSLTEFELKVNHLNKDILINPNISITDMTAKDFNENFQNDIDQTLKDTAIAVVSSEDDDDDIIEQEILSNRKVFVDQESQAVETEIKPKKKTKSSQSKKTKSSPRRSKQSTNIPPSTVSSLSSTNPIPSHNDSITIKPSASTTKTEEVKSIITVDTSKARSNLEVVRLCLKELGWKEVNIFLTYFILSFYMIFIVFTWYTT
jgi:hypothetical protein